MPLFPTKRWLDEYGQLLDESDELADLTSGVGPEFANDVMLVITDLPIEETTLADLPETAIEEIPEDLRKGNLDMTLAEVLEEVDEDIRSSLPITLRALIDQYEECVINGKIYVHIEIQDDDTVDLTVVNDPGSYSVDSVFRGPCSTWQQIVEGRPALSALLTGDMVIESVGLHQFQYTTVLQLFGEVATDVETTHIYRDPDSSLADFFLDETIRQPVTVQRMLHRQAALATDALTPF